MILFSLQPHTFHFKRPARTSRGDLATRQVWFVRAWDAEQPEIVGWGECGPTPGLSVDALPPSLPANGEMDNLEVDTAKQPALAFAIETALLDLQAGGQQRLFATAFSRGETGLPTHGLIWMDSAQGVLEQIERKVMQQFTVIKMKVGALSFDEDLALLTEVRTRYPTIELRLDANGAFDAEDVLDKLEQLAVLNIAFLEQPIRAGQWNQLTAICRHSPIPIGLDEELIGATNPRALLETIRPQHLILKPTLLGGFAACAEWMQCADEIGAQWWINSLLESNIGLNAICQWTSTLADGRIHGLGTGQLFADYLQSPLVLRGNQLWIDPSQTWLIG